MIDSIYKYLLLLFFLLQKEEGMLRLRFVRKRVTILSEPLWFSYWGFPDYPIVPKGRFLYTQSWNRWWIQKKAIKDGIRPCFLCGWQDGTSTFYSINTFTDIYPLIRLISLEVLFATLCTLKHETWFIPHLLLQIWMKTCFYVYHTKSHHQVHCHESCKGCRVHHS